MSYSETDSESSSVDTFDMTEGAIYARTTQAQCGVIEEAYLEISTADGQSDDRYCGIHLAQTADGTSISAKSAGVVYAAESNPWNFGVIAMSNEAQNKVGGFSIVAQQLPCGAGSPSGIKENGT